MERERKLHLLESSNLGEAPLVEEVLAGLGRDHNSVDLKLALAEMYRRGWYAQQKVQFDKACAGLPADAPLPQLLKRLGIPIREDRSIPSAAAVTRIRQAITDRFRSMRGLAFRAHIDESTLRKVLKNERADLATLQKIAGAMGVSTNTLLSDLK
jgi:transcriptional regulator with XRE-family HTH domain